MHRSRGFTLTEVLVAFAVTLAVTGAALSVALASRKLYSTDLARTRLNQSLRSARDFLVGDIRQAGERLPATFPAIEIVRGQDLPGGSPGDPDELVLRRNLVDTILRSCREVSGSERRIYLAELEDDDENVPPGCFPVPDNNGDSWPDNHEIWNDYRLTHGLMLEGQTSVAAYLYNPTTGQGEFFSYWRDARDEGYIEAAPGHTWNLDYPVDDGCQVYLLEERRYRLRDGVLQIVVNRTEAAPLNLVDGLRDLQLRARFRTPPPPAPQDEPAPAETFGFGDTWRELRAVEVELAGRVPMKNQFLEREWSGEIMPRNVLSR